MSVDPRPKSPEQAQADNLALWDGLATLHGAGLPGYYDVNALTKGHDPIQPEIDAELRLLAPSGIAGLDVLHLQCHVGIDTVELARRGARVTGVDFSPAALDAAARIAQRAGVTVELVQADATALPPALRERFDLVYVTIGAIEWIRDLNAWMTSVATCLRPGGALLLFEIHPLRHMADTLDPLVLDMTYTHDAEGLHFDEDGSYADPDAKLPATKGTVWSHSLGDVVTSAVRAGLVVERLVEQTEASFDAMGDGLVKEADGRYRWRIDGGQPLPLQYALVARKPN